MRSLLDATRSRRMPTNPPPHPSLVHSVYLFFVLLGDRACLPAVDERISPVMVDVCRRGGPIDRDEKYPIDCYTNCLDLFAESNRACCHPVQTAAVRSSSSSSGSRDDGDDGAGRQ